MKKILRSIGLGGLIVTAPFVASAGNFSPGNRSSSAPLDLVVPVATETAAESTNLPPAEANPPAMNAPVAVPESVAPAPPVSETTPEPAPVNPPAVSEVIPPPIPVTPAPAAETNTHLLASDELVEIKVYRQPDLDTRARIDREGGVTMPLLGTVNIGGKTVEQARNLVRELLAKEYLVNPQVNLTVVEYAKRTFTILGEVQRPGTYEIPGGQSFNLLQAIAFAGGYTRIGSPSKVTLQRMEDGRKKVIDLDAGRMAKDENVPPFQILPNDTINVGERFF